MNKIYKYEIDLTDEQVITLPESAKILSIIEQRNHIMLYALVDIEHVNTTTNKKIRIVGTGQQFPDSELWDFVSTVSLDGGLFVWHVFKLRCDHDRLR